MKSSAPSPYTTINFCGSMQWVAGVKSGAAQLLDHFDARLRFLTKLLQFFR